jgi:hypothetical protein
MRLTDPEGLDETCQRDVAVYERLPIVTNDVIETVVRVFNRTLRSRSVGRVEHEHFRMNRQGKAL